MGRGAAVAALALVALAGGAPVARAATGPAVPILMYHHVAAAPAGVGAPALWVSPGAFASQVGALRAAGYRAVTLGRVWDAWHGGARLPRRPVVLTFDDGYADQVAAALPVLRRARWPGVLNLALDLLPAMGGVPAVRQLLGAGWELDSHSVSHAELRTLGRTRLRTEVAGSRARIRSLFGVTPRFFCYPFGHFDGAVAGAVRRAGYLGATTTRAAFATPRTPFFLPRVQVSRGESASDLLRRLRALRLRAGRQ
ncbi:MAG TPA: polysaccharide deacetylase family protein [Solirubrobacteraceae bacterium]|nr:polysaccharide deacetylase family protein [Solirubrobacteraceae bacterium]